MVALQSDIPYSNQPSLKMNFSELHTGVFKSLIHFLAEILLFLKLRIQFYFLYEKLKKILAN